MKKVKVYLNVTELGTVIISVHKGDHTEVLYQLCIYARGKGYDKVIREESAERLIHYSLDDMTVMDYHDLIRFFNLPNVDNDVCNFELIFV